MTVSHRCSRRDSLAQAHEALARYALGPAAVTHQGDSENTTFRVDAESDGTRFLLRRHKPELHAPPIPAALRSELTWLAALHDGTEIIAPYPAANREGEWVTQTDQGWWTLTVWVEGRFYSDRHNPSRASRAGAMLARLHRHSETWVRPLEWTRPRHDVQRLHESLSTYRQAAEAGLMTAEELRVLEAAADRVSAGMAAVGESPPSFGLIHGDFHNRNYLFHQGQVRPIDFSLCGDGYYLADLGYALCSLWHRRVFLDGYLSLRPLAEAHLPLIETFMVFGILGETAFHLKNARNQGRPFDSPTWLVTNLRDKFLRGERFLRDW